MKIKAVVFDVEGVILATNEFHAKSWVKVFNDEGIDFTKKDAQKLYGLSRLEALEKGIVKSKKFYTLEEKFALTEKKNEIYREYLESLTPNDVLPGVKSVIHDLKNMGLLVCAESLSRSAELMLKKIGLLSQFDATVFGNEIKERKPNPEIFIKVAKKLGLDSSSCLAVVDDNKSIIAAEKAKMFSVVTGFGTKNSVAQFCIRSLSELKSVILSIENEE